MARPVTRARASTALVRPVTRARSRICRLGSSRSPGPEPYQLASLGACRCVRPEAPCLSGSSRSFGPEAVPLWLVPSPGPEQHQPPLLVPSPGRGAVSAALARPVPRARSSIGDRPLLRWALGLRMFGPYFALGRDLASATFALGAVSMTGRSLLRCPCYAAPAVRSTVAS